MGYRKHQSCSMQPGPRRGWKRLDWNQGGRVLY
jgi:hypothetical protein